MMRAMHKELICIKADGVHLEGMLDLPRDSVGTVLFAHGSGSSRFSPRNNFVAERLRQARLGTMLVDLLTPNEDKNTSTRFNIPLLTQRLNAAFDWLQQNESTAGYPLGLFGASTGAAAALQVAAMHNTDIAAVVSRGGRPDLAGDHALGKVRAPTLLIVGSRDFTVIELNRKAYATLNCVKRLETVPHATHLFEEPGKLEAVSVLASEWFSRYLVTSPAP